MKIDRLKAASLVGLLWVSACSEESPRTAQDAQPTQDAALLVDSRPSIEEPPCVPSPERCDGLDNDCDGLIDEDFPLLGQPCDEGADACHSEGRWACDAEGTGVTCVYGQVREPTAEICDGLDNDCDGAIDEGFDFNNDPAHCSACDQVCAYPNAQALCLGGQCLRGDCAEGFGDADGDPSNGCECTITGPEVCDGADNNCDGRVDEGFGVGQPCVIGVGACRAEGLTVCDADGQLRCDAPIIEPRPEVCNGIDDDCDGAIDEDFDADGDGFAHCPDLDCSPNAPCPPGVGCAVACARQDCDDADPGRSPGAREICEDGIDQNCDGHDAPCTQAVSRIHELIIVDSASTAALCEDFSGDGEPDNAFAKLAPIANPMLADALDQGAFLLLPALQGHLPDLSDGLVDLSVLVGEQVGPNSYRAHPDSYDEAGAPLMVFPNTRLRDRTLTAGPGLFRLGLPMPGGEPGDLQVREAHLSAQLSAEAPSMRYAQGRLVGIVLQEDLDVALSNVPESFMPFIENLLTPDLDLDLDGVPEAYSACVLFAASPIEYAP